MPLFNRPQATALALILLISGSSLGCDSPTDADAGDSEETTQAPASDEDNDPRASAQEGDEQMDGDVQHSDDRRQIYHLRAERTEEWSADAVLDEDFWLQSPTIRLNPALQARHQHSMVHLLYSDDALYIGARLQSDHITPDDDRLSLFLHPGSDSRWSRLDLHPDGTAALVALEESGESPLEEHGIEVATDFDPETTEGFWIAEARLPLADIHDAPETWDDGHWRGAIVRTDTSPHDQPRHYTLSGGFDEDLLVPDQPQWLEWGAAVEEEVEMRDPNPDMDGDLLREMETQPPLNE